MIGNITRKDILNIKREFNINDRRLDTNDVVSVENWVHSFIEENIPVVFFKQQRVLEPSIPELAENDFLWVIMNHWQKKKLNQFGNSITCMDFMHGLNEYNFDMKTLLVVDDKREGLPSAFIISNQYDSVLLTFALNATKNCDVNISFKTFMSDVNTFYNAWRSVFAEVKIRLMYLAHPQKLEKEVERIFQ